MGEKVEDQVKDDSKEKAKGHKSKKGDAPAPHAGTVGMPPSIRGGESGGGDPSASGRCQSDPPNGSSVSPFSVGECSSTSTTSTAAGGATGEEATAPAKSPKGRCPLSGFRPASFVL